MIIYTNSFRSQTQPLCEAIPFLSFLGLILSTLAYPMGHLIFKPSALYPTMSIFHSKRHENFKMLSHTPIRYWKCERAWEDLLCLDKLKGPSIRLVIDLDDLQKSNIAILERQYYSLSLLLKS